MRAIAVCFKRTPGVQGSTAPCSGAPAYHEIDGTAADFTLLYSSIHNSFGVVCGHKHSKMRYKFKKNAKNKQYIPK